MFCAIGVLMDLEFGVDARSLGKSNAPTEGGTQEILLEMIYGENRITERHFAKISLAVFDMQKTQASKGSQPHRLLPQWRNLRQMISIRPNAAHNEHRHPRSPAQHQPLP
jgi:hypothetical protein